METITEATARLRSEGYAEDWIAERGMLRCYECASAFDPSDVAVDEVVRFEGPSDPGDEAILFALTGPCAHRGVYTAAFGTYTSAEDLQVIDKLRR